MLHGGEHLAQRTYAEQASLTWFDETKAEKPLTEFAGQDTRARIRKQASRLREQFMDQGEVASTGKEKSRPRDLWITRRLWSDGAASST